MDNNKQVRKDFVANLHRYSVAEIAEFKASSYQTYLEKGTGIYFYAADHIDRMIHLQEEYIRELESNVKRIRNAHDKLYAQLKKLKNAIERANL